MTPGTLVHIAVNWHQALSEISAGHETKAGRHDGHFRAPHQLAWDSHSAGFRLIQLATLQKGTQTLTEREQFGISAVFPGGLSRLFGG
jgi:hypothetical protein